MIRLLSSSAIALVALSLSLVQSGQLARASGGNNSIQTVALHRQDCTATTAGPLTGTVRFSLDDQGGGNVNPNGVEIRVGVTAGLPRTSYDVQVIGSACQLLADGGTLTTDDSGRGDLDFHVLGSTVPPGTNTRVRTVAPADVLTSDSVSAP